MFYFTLQFKIELLPFVAIEIQKFILYYQEIKMKNDKQLQSKLIKIAQKKLSDMDKFYQNYYEDYRIGNILKSRVLIRQLLKDYHNQLNKSTKKIQCISEFNEQKMETSKSMKIFPMVKQSDDFHQKNQKNIVQISKQQKQFSIQNNINFTKNYKSPSPTNSNFSRKEFTLSSFNNQISKVQDQSKNITKIDYSKNIKHIINKSSSIKSIVAPLKIKKQSNNNDIKNSKAKYKPISKQQYISYLNKKANFIEKN